MISKFRYLMSMNYFSQTFSIFNTTNSKFSTFLKHSINLFHLVIKEKLQNIVLVFVWFCHLKIVDGLMYKQFTQVLYVSI